MTTSLFLIVKVIVLPEVTLSMCKSLEPAWQDAAGWPWSPVVRMIVVIRHNATIGSPLEKPSKTVDDDVADNSAIVCQNLTIRIMARRSLRY